MTESTMQETLIETTVNYTIEYQGQLYLIEQVPARVCQETGEEYFSPDTVEHIQALIKSGRPPARVITTPVYRYA
jgi:YgiT-type zinc finger domain-containing protein